MKHSYVRLNTGGSAPALAARGAHTHTSTVCYTAAIKRPSINPLLINRANNLIQYANEYTYTLNLIL